MNPWKINIVSTITNYAPKLGMTFTARIFTKLGVNSINYLGHLCQILFTFKEKRRKFFSFLGLNKVPL